MKLDDITLLLMNRICDIVCKWCFLFFMDNCDRISIWSH